MLSSTVSQTRTDTNTEHTAKQEAAAAALTEHIPPPLRLVLGQVEQLVPRGVARAQVEAQVQVVGVDADRQRVGNRAEDVEGHVHVDDQLGRVQTDELCVVWTRRNVLS